MTRAEASDNDSLFIEYQEAGAKNSQSARHFPHSFGNLWVPFRHALAVIVHIHIVLVHEVWNRWLIHAGFQAEQTVEERGILANGGAEDFALLE